MTIRKLKILLICFIIASCSRIDDKNEVKINFNEIDNKVVINQFDSTNTIKVAVAAMISPNETFSLYKKLVDYIGLKLNKKVQLIQKKTYTEVNNMIENGDLDFAFICSGAYVKLADKIPTEILAVPQTNGKCYYQAYIIANKNSRISSFLGFKNHTFAFTDPLSNTGKLYPLKRLKEQNLNFENFFGKTLYTNAHDLSIQLVNKGIVDGASVDGLIFEYIKKKNPNSISNIDIIEKSEYYGIPPIVARKNNHLNESIRQILYSMNKDSSCNAILNQLSIEKFMVGYDSSYISIRNIEKFVNK